MATEKKSVKQKNPKTSPRSTKLSVKDTTKRKTTSARGKKAVAQKTPARAKSKPIKKKQVQNEAAPQAIMEVPQVSVERKPDLGAGFAALKSRVMSLDLATWLFILALALYLTTRLIGLSQFPIYFFTDEAIQSQSMLDLIRNGYRDPSDVLLPAFFRNGEYYNIGLSVYLQWLPVLLFGKSAVATRATSAIVTLLAAISVGIILRDVFKTKYWWIGTLFLSITPSWFLHSRTAFETAEFVALYAGALCSYLLYRTRSPSYLYLAVLLGSMAFYTYGAAQMVVPLTAAGLFLSDWRYHWDNRRTVLLSLGLVVVLALPYLRFRISDHDAPLAHLHTLFSYWTQGIPLSEKLSRYSTEYWTGLSPWYWYVPNDRDMGRHLMKGYGNIMIATLPFAIIGLAHTIRSIRLPGYRAILIATMAAPTAAAIVQMSITRGLGLVVLAAIVTSLGFERVMRWIESPKQRLVKLAQGTGLTPLRIAGAVLILALGIWVALICRESINSATAFMLALLVAVPLSGVHEYIARRFIEPVQSTEPAHRKFLQTIIALSAFLVLSAVNVSMLNDALRNGPLWFRDYGLGGMQYGAFQIFDYLEGYVKEHPGTRVIFSPDWANGTDLLARFFLDPSTQLEVGSVRGHLTKKLPLDKNTLFVMTPQEFTQVQESNKVTDIEVETIIPYPDGTPGFYFIHLRYVDNIDDIFAAEKAVRQVMQEGTFTIDGQPVKVRYTYLDAEMQFESMALVFDDNPYTLAKTFETNPFVIEMTFPETRSLNGFSIVIGSAYVQITLRRYSEAGAEPFIHVFEGQGTPNEPELSFDLPAPEQVRVLQLEVLDLSAPSESFVHIWEVKLR